MQSYADFVSTIEVTDKQTGKTQGMVAQLNSPAENHGLYYFQAAWDGNPTAGAGERFSVLGVGNRPGIRWMIVGSILMIMGIGYAFYVKPILLKVKKGQLAAWAAARKATTVNHKGTKSTKDHKEWGLIEGPWMRCSERYFLGVGFGGFMRRWMMAVVGGLVMVMAGVAAALPMDQAKPGEGAAAPAGAIAPMGEPGTPAGRPIEVPAGMRRWRQ